MRTVTLGSSGLEVSALGFGSMGLSGVYGEADDESSIATLRRAFELGITFFDTADIYGDGHNEQLVARALSAQRASLVIATKFGGGTGPDGEIRGLARPELVEQYLRASLQRLGTDYVDLYYLHRVDPATPIEETVGAMARLVEKGLVRHLGLSEVSAETLRRAHAVHPISALQTEYSLFERGAEKEALPVTRELGVTFVAYSPLGRGFLGGGVKSAKDLDPDDWRASVPRFQGSSLSSAIGLSEELARLGAPMGLSAGQLALAWIFAESNDVVPIPGTRSITHLEANVASLDVQLDDSVLEYLNRTFYIGALSSDRMPPESMLRINL
jgi:aryl-alcohol dehydrogenase-like predicted oxidoreductase